ncbi:MAG: hypothetical protein AAFV47_05480 [Pseudomonadota bacterium]
MTIKRNSVSTLDGDIMRLWSQVTVAIALLTLLSACSSPIANRNPTGERFPSVVGQTLEEQTVALPEDLSGAPAILLVGYLQETQFDIDRWLLGMLQGGVDARILEVPTIPGAIASIASGFIDDGMRSGIPREDWKVVVTVYGSAAKPIAELTGTENGNNARVLVLDRDGTIVWFDDTGYSARKILTLLELLKAMQD